jgi:hypothetical protein
MLPIAYGEFGPSRWEFRTQTTWAADGAETPGLAASGESCHRRGHAASSDCDPKEKFAAAMNS